MISTSYAFYDNFDDLNITIWDIYNEGDIEILNDSNLLITNTNSRSSVFMQTKYSANILDYIEIKFRYLENNYNFGSGIAINDSFVDPRIYAEHPDKDDWIVYVWPILGNRYRIFTSICLEGSDNCLPSDNIVTTVSGSDFYDWQTLKILFKDSRYYLYLNNIEIGTTVTTLREPNYIWIGNPMITNGVNFSDFNIDYISTENSTYYSQSDDQWGEDMYDTAENWTLEEPTISRWGCALTSAAMVMKHNDIRLYNNDSCEEADPGVLNDWLNDQEDGYVGNGYVNWIALTRFARESHENDCSDTELEFARTQYEVGQEVEEYSILGLDGHFVVAESEDENAFTILDPADQGNTLVSKDDVINVNTFTPSLTDLSYIYSTSETLISTNIFSYDGSEGSLNFEYEPLKSDKGEGDNQKGLTNSTLAKPQSDKYILTVSNDSVGPYEGIMQLFLYDKEGNVNAIDLELNILAGETEYYYFEYSNLNIEFVNLENMDFGYLVWWLYEKGEIDFDKAMHLSSYYLTIGKFEFNLRIRNLLINNLKNYLLNNSPEYISFYAYDILYNYKF